jgi:hypothetical protein
MATIEQLTQQLIDVNKDQVVVNEENVDAIDNLTKSVNKLLKFQKDQSKKSGADLEAQRESNRTMSRTTTSSGDVSTAGGGFGFGKMVATVSAWAANFILKFKKFFSMLKSLLLIGARATGIGGLIFLIYQTFKDIGDNPMFKETMEKLTKLWNEDIGPRLECFKDLVQDFFLNSLNVVIDSAESIFSGLDALMDGEWKLGMKNLLRGTLGYDYDTGKFVNEGIWGVISASITGILGIFGIETTPAELTKELNESITKTISSVTGWITGIVDSITTWVDESSQMLGDAWETTKTSFKEKWEAFSGFFTIDIPLWLSSRKLDFDLWLGDLKISFTKKWEAFSGFFTETIPGWFETTKDKFVTAWDASKDLLKTKWDEVVKFFTKDVPKYFTDWLATAVENVIDPIAATWARVVDWFLKVNTDITTKYEEIKAFGLNIISGVKDTWCDVVEFFTKTIPDKMKETWESIKAFGVNLLGTAETGLKMYWDFLVDFYTVKIPAAMKAVWEIIKAGGTGILDNISAKWESLKCFFIDTIPEKISNFLSPLENFDIMAKITEGFATVKTFFTKTVPDKIAEFDPLKDFDLIGSLTTSISELLDSIVSIIPSGEAIKKMLINAAMAVPGGEKVLQLVGLVSKPITLDPNNSAGMSFVGGMNTKIVSDDFTHGLTNAELMIGESKAKLISKTMQTYGVANQDGSISTVNNAAAENFRNRFKAAQTPVELVQSEKETISNLTEAISINTATIAAAAAQRMDAAGTGNYSSIQNNYVAASQGSTDPESSWVSRYILGPAWRN